MDSKSFAVGLASGAFCGATAGWILASSEDEVEAISAGPERSAAIVPDLNPVPSTTQKHSQAGVESRDEVPPEIPSGSKNTSDSRAPWPANQWQEIELEPKDDGWAYYMEQTLVQFLGGHASAAKFDISRIECKTTMCQLEVVGYDSSTEPVWRQVMYDIRHQPWSEFAHYGTSSGNVDGNFVLLRRPPAFE
jgi:hypothetical protein